MGLGTVQRSLGVFTEGYMHISIVDATNGNLEYVWEF